MRIFIFACLPRLLWLKLTLFPWEEERCQKGMWSTEREGSCPHLLLIFHLEMNSLLEPVEGNGKVGGSLESPTPHPLPKCRHTLFYLLWFLLGPLETHGLRREVEGMGEGGPCKAFLSVFHNNRTVCLLWGKGRTFLHRKMASPELL